MSRSPGRSQPALRTEPRPPDAPPDRAARTTPREPRPAPLVLVAEDSRTQAEMIRLTLEASGFRVVVVDDGAKALEWVANGGADLVLTDIEMPVMDGFELCSRLKDDPRSRHIPVVVLTQRDRVTDIIRALEVGADNYLTKPFAPEELVTRVGRLLDEVGRWRRRTRAQRHRLAGPSDELILSFERTQVVETLMAAAEKIETELGTVGEIGLGLTMDHDLDELLGMIAARTRELSGAATVAIGLCDDATVCDLRVTSDGRVAPDGSSAPFPFAHLGLDPTALVSRESLVVGLDGGLPPDLDRWFDARSGGTTLLVVPLVVDARLVGLLVPAFARDRVFRSEELRRYRTLGDQTAVAIENARALERERRLRERIQQLQRAAGDLGIRHGRAAASQRAVDLAREALSAEYGALLVRDRDGGTLFVTSGHSEATQAGLHPPVGRGLLGLDLVRGQSVRVPSVAGDPRSGGVPAGHPPLDDLLIVPVYGADRQLGQLYVANSLDGGFTQDDEQLLPTLAEHVGTMLESGTLIDDLRHARAAEARLGRLLDESSDEIHVVDAETLRFVQTNATARRNLGYSEEELSRMTPADLHSNTADAVAALLEPLRAGERDQVRIEAVQRRKDGSTYPVEVRLQYVASEEPPVFVSSVQDITGRRELEGQLRQTQKMEAIGHLAGGIAHDFNNILSAISGYAQLVASDLDPADERRADVERILDASDRAARLIRQLLAFGRRQVLHPLVLDLNAVVRGIDALLRPLVGDTVVLTVALDPDLGTVRADPSQLEQVIMNLVTNARDAMPSGGRLTIETANVELDRAYVASHADAQPGPHVMLAVSDTGVGMDAATMARLFEPFFTTKEPGKGTGLGLATTYGIVKQSGGNIWVYSEPDRGTSFKVYLPRVEDDGGIGAAGDRQEPATPVGGTEVVLLAEDDPEVRALVETILARHGYTVLSAPDGRTALDVAAATDSIALLITDVMMPGLRGPELAERLVALRPGLRVLYISGYAAEAVGNHDLVARGATYLEKPFTPDLLARTVRTILDGPEAGADGS